ncbi:hypothetical protein Gasu2_21000 [Galdieria sulphuraria]|nr:hypothetical protein Gasu2_21000 [Galdieria sulphuraria]
MCTKVTGPSTGMKSQKGTVPRKFYIRSDKYGDMFLSSLSSLPRLGTGAFVLGYRVERHSEGFREYSDQLPVEGPRIFKPKVKQLGGKFLFPYLVDPNTGFAGYESDDIIEYLFQTYGSGKVPFALSRGFITNITSSLSSAVRLGKGVMKLPSVEPIQKLELWSYEASP